MTTPPFKIFLFSSHLQRVIAARFPRGPTSTPFLLSHLCSVKSMLPRKHLFVIRRHRRPFAICSRTRFHSVLRNRISLPLVRIRTRGLNRVGVYKCHKAHVSAFGFATILGSGPSNSHLHILHETPSDRSVAETLMRRTCFLERHEGICVLSKTGPTSERWGFGACYTQCSVGVHFPLHGSVIPKGIWRLIPLCR